MEIVPHKNLLQPKQGNGGGRLLESFSRQPKMQGGGTFFGRTGYDGLVRGKREEFPPVSLAHGKCRNRNSSTWQEIPPKKL